MAFLANLNLGLSRLKLQDILINPDNLFYKKFFFNCHGFFLLRSISQYSHLSNKRDVTLTNFRKFHPARNKSPPLQNVQYSYKTFNTLTETIKDFPSDHFELYIFILAQKLTEKVQLILQLLHPYTFLPTFTVIREMRVDAKAKKHANESK